MARPRRTTKPKAPRGDSGNTGPATLRSMSGAGSDFEDLISAWQLVKALSGEHAPGIANVVAQVQAQVSTLLLLTIRSTSARMSASGQEQQRRPLLAGQPWFKSSTDVRPAIASCVASTRCAVLGAG